jgi:hypothetical protein
MDVFWKRKRLRSGTAQWVFFCAVAAAVGLVVFVLAALGLMVGALLAGIISVAVARASRRRADGASVYAVRTGRPAGGHEPEGTCVELDKDAYIVRIVDEKKP